MPRELPPVLNVLIIAENSEADLDRIRAVAPDRLNVIPVWKAFQSEIKREWPPNVTMRAGGGVDEPERTPAEIEELVLSAHVVLLSLGHPKTLPARAPELIWAHFPFAGVSNLMTEPWWGIAPMVTTCRGVAYTAAVAESVMAATFMFARGLSIAAAQTMARSFTPAAYTSVHLVHGRTMAIVGLGGIGSHLAGLARACGMRVLASRRSATRRDRNVQGVDELFPAANLLEMLAEADFVALCPAWTPETERMLDAAAFAALKPGACILNVGRGELIETAALIDGLTSGRVKAAYLDVWDDDTMGTPPADALLDLPNVVCSPHVSNRSVEPRTFIIDLFCANLRRLLDGDELVNVIDWQRGY